MSRKLSAIALVLALGLWVPIFLERASVPLELGLFAFAALLLAGTKPGEAGRVPLALGACALRSILGAVVLGVGTAILAAPTLMAAPPGFAPLQVEPSVFVLAGASLGFFLGPLAIFEHRAATRTGRGAALLAAGLAAWASFVALCLGWLEAHYVSAMTEAGRTRWALRAVRDAGSMLLECPRWTLEDFGWCALPVGAVTWSRLRGWSLPGQVTLALAVSGAARELFPEKLPIVAYGLAGLSIALPVVFLAADRIVKRFAPEEPTSPEQGAPSRWPWIAAVSLCVLSTLPLLVRELQRARRRSELAAIARERLPDWRAVAGKGAYPELRARIEALMREVAPLVSAARAVPGTATAEECAPLLARVSDAESRWISLVMDAGVADDKVSHVKDEAHDVLSEIRKCGGGPTEQEQTEIERIAVDSRREFVGEAVTLQFLIEQAQGRLPGH